MNKVLPDTAGSVNSKYTLTINYKCQWLQDVKIHINTAHYQSLKAVKPKTQVFQISSRVGPNTWLLAHLICNILHQERYMCRFVLNQFIQSNLTPTKMLIIDQNGNVFCISVNGNKARFCYESSSLVIEILHLLCQTFVIT